MKTFIFKSILFALILIATLTLFILFNKEYLAAYKVTSSYSFNEKVKWLPSVKKIEIMTIGSSMSLNNISSHEIVSAFNTSHYLNISSWGINIKDLEVLIPAFTALYSPKIVLCASNIVDFITPSIRYEIKDLVREIRNKTDARLHFFFDKYYTSRTLDNRRNYFSNDVYTSLNFDSFGGVSFTENNFNIIDSRWNEPLPWGKLYISNYDSLSDISIFLKNHDIQFIFIQTPVRQSIRTPIFLKKMDKHIKKVTTSVESSGFTVIDLSNVNFPDSLFVDSTHLNRKGADLLTKIIILEYKAQNKAGVKRGKSVHAPRHSF